MRLDRETRIALLALRGAAHNAQGRLAKELQSEPPLGDLCALGPWRPSRAQWWVAERQVRILELFDITLVPVWKLPARLRRAEPLPPMLFVRGNPALLERDAVAIIGSRNPRRDAEAWAFERAAEAVQDECVVVSGGARGVDTAAHAGALQVGGKTVAYIGVPADRIYPPSNKKLFRRILDGGGALVSEHPPGVSTPAYEHARRNRFIAAHARRVLIAEARLSSGTMSTATYAERYGVPVEVSPTGVGAQRDGIDLLLTEGRAQSLTPRSTRYRGG